MKILVTGGAGFIGSHLTDKLLELGEEVLVSDNLSLGSLDNLKEAQKNKNFQFIKCDLCNYDEIYKIFKENRIKTVFHFAANSDISASVKNPETDLNNTFQTTYNVLKAMKDFNVKKIIFASTSAIYGEANEPLTENYGPLFPVSHYGASKLASEAFISSFASAYGIQAYITRFPNVVGERATHGVIPDFVKKLKNNPDKLSVLGDGEQNKPYLYIADLINAIFFILENANEKINVYNIGVNSQTKVKTIAEAVINEINPSAKIEYTGGKRGWIGDVPEFIYNTDKINNLGWKAKMTSDEAVKTAIKKILEAEK